MFSNRKFFTVMICMLNKSCPDSLMVDTVKKKGTNDNNKGQLFSNYKVHSFFSIRIYFIRIPRLKFAKS